MNLFFFPPKQYSLLNDCHSLMDCIELSLKNKLNNSNATSLISSDINTSENLANNKPETIVSQYELRIATLESEKRDLLAQLNNQTQSLTGTIESLTITATINESSNATPDMIELKQKLELSEKLVDGLREQAIQLSAKVNEMTSLYETTKQIELDEKNKIKHLERSIRALKIEKGIKQQKNFSKFYF